MSTLILYMTKHGTTEKMAKLLQHELNETNIQLINLHNEKNPDISGFDKIIIGASIHAGKIQKRIRKFCENNLEQLKTKRIGLFLCCMDEKKVKIQFDNAFPEALRNHSEYNSYFGGEFLLDKMNFLEKAIVKKVAGINNNVSKINLDEIKFFAHKLR